MIIVRKRQIEAFEQDALRAFEDDMVRHCAELSPHLCKALRDEQLRRAIQDAIARARSHGFTHRGPVRLYIDLSLFFGCGFDTDPQYPWAAEILRRDDFEEQMHRAEALYERSSAYLAEVVGPKGAHAREALQRLLRLEEQELVLYPETLVIDALRWLKELYPQKYAHTGPDALERLVVAAIARARAVHGFKAPRSLLLFTTLTFAFGHYCDEDPLYGWIQQTLMTHRDGDRERVAHTLERRAAGWFKIVLRGELSPEIPDDDRQHAS